MTSLTQGPSLKMDYDYEDDQDVLDPDFDFDATEGFGAYGFSYNAFGRVPQPSSACVPFLFHIESLGCLGSKIFILGLYTIFMVVLGFGLLYLRYFYIHYCKPREAMMRGIKVFLRCVVIIILFLGDFVESAVPTRDWVYVNSPDRLSPGRRRLDRLRAIRNLGACDLQLLPEPLPQDIRHSSSEHIYEEMQNIYQSPYDFVEDPIYQEVNELGAGAGYKVTAL